MKTAEMDADLATYTDFEKCSERVSYWRRRLALSPKREELTEEFDRIVAAHAQRTLGVMRAG